MRKKLKIHSGERVDVVDYLHGANQYTEDSEKFFGEQLLLDRRSRILNGFRVKVEDQTVNPGLITVFNGYAFDRDGSLINNEELSTDSRSVTLLGSSQTFYVEIEFTEVTSDTDGRYFWDPTVPATAPEVDGSEFSLNVATRITPDWRIVTPVSTTGFTQTTTPGTVRIPLCKLSTNGSNQIVVGGTNPGLVLVQPASVLESDVLAGATQLRVLDSRTFPVPPFTVTVDVGGTSPETRTVSAVDSDHHILTVPALTNAHSAGAIIRASAAAADLVRENTNPAVTAHPDPAQRLFQGDEIRGSGIAASKETFGSRDDLNVRNLKDYVDLLSSQVRELKFGNLRSDIVSTAPPLSFGTTPRWFDRAGSVLGAKTNTVSIGNGTTSFGDFNGTTDAVFTAAIAALPGSGGIVYVKTGTYTFTNSVSVGKPVRFVGDGVGATVVVGNAVTPFTVSANSSFEALTIQNSGGATTALTITAAVSVALSACSVLNGVVISGAVSAAINASRTTFQPSASVAAISGSGGGALINARFTNCAFVAMLACSTPQTSCVYSGCIFTTPTVFAAAGASDSLTNVTVTDSAITCTSAAFSSSSSQSIFDVRFSRNYILVTNLAANGAVFLMDAPGTLWVEDNRIAITGGATTAANPGAVVRSVSSSIAGGYVTVSNNSIDANSSSFVVGAWVDISDLGYLRFDHNNCFFLVELVRIGSTNDYMNFGRVYVTNNIHNNGNLAGHVDTYGVRFLNTPAVTDVLISENQFLYLGSSSNAGVRYGVDCTFAGSTTVSIRDNTMSGFAGPTTSNSAGVYFGSIATAASGKVTVSGNTITDIQAGPTGTASGVYLDPNSGTASIEFKVNGNRIFDVGTSDGRDCFGVLVSDSVGPGEVANNFIGTIESTSTTGKATGIQLDTSQRWRIAENTVIGVECANTTYLTSVTGVCIRATGSLVDVIIDRNYCTQEGATTAANAGTVMAVISDSVETLAITRNILASSAGNGPVYGLFVSRDASTAASMQDMDISGNSVEMLASTSSWYGMQCIFGGASSGIRVQNNSVRERSLGGGHVGMGIRGHNNSGFTRAVDVSGNVLSGMKTGTLVTGRVGMRFSDMQISAVTNNIIDWLEPSVAEGTGLQITSDVLAVYKLLRVAGNVVRGDANGTTYEIDINATYAQYGLLDSNVVNTDTAAGVINPAVAPANWVYGTNA